MPTPGVLRCLREMVIDKEGEGHPEVEMVDFYGMGSIHITLVQELVPFIPADQGSIANHCNSANSLQRVLNYLPIISAYHL